MPKSKQKPAHKPKAKTIQQPEIRLEDFDEAEIDKLLAEKSFHEFVKQAWHLIEPGQEFCDNWHIEGICLHLEGLFDGRISQLLINVPPGTMKSLLMNVFWPAWVWATKPEKRFMFSSYAEDLSMRDSVKCRNIILSDWYQERWPIAICEDQNTKGKFQNTKGGWRMVGSIGGKGIGEHPDFNCLDSSVKIKCRHGEIKIGKIVKDKKRVEVLSFNHQSGKKEWKPATFFSKTAGKQCLRIRTSSGKTITCSEQHPILVDGQGYKEARFLQIGDAVFSELHCLQSSDEEEPAMGTTKILFAEMPRGIYSRRESSFIQGEIQIQLQDLRENGRASKLRKEKKSEILLGKMSGEGDAQKGNQQAMCILRKDDDCFAIGNENLLFQDMREHGAPEKNSWEEQSEIRSREIAGEIPEWIHSGSEKSETEGQMLPSMRAETSESPEGAGRASHQLRQDGQQLESQSDYSLSDMSWENAREKKAACDLGIEIIESIEDAGIPDFIYNIGVEGNHNYFANGILTHNCCDDPHNVKKAESDQERQNVIDWLDGTFSTRGVSRGVRKALIMQRLHYKDASGHLLAKGGWTHICLPMRYESPALTPQPDGTKKLVSRMNPTPINWNDPRKVDGELLWPKLYPEEVVQTLETNLGIYHSAGQLQQRPAPRGGGTFKRVWFEIVTAIPVLDKIVRYWDKAGTAKGSGAQTASVLIASYTDSSAALPAMKKKFIVLDVITCRENAAEREAIIKQTAATDAKKWGHVETWVEQEPGSGGKESAEGTIGNLSGFVCKVERVTGSKEVRADPMASQASVGKIKLLSAAWNQDFLDELEHFPVGKLKDQVDAAGGGFNKLNAASGAFESASDLMAGDTGGLPTPTPVEIEELTFDENPLE